MRIVCPRLCLAAGLSAQTNLQLQIPGGVDILKGNYDPATYAQTNPINQHNLVLAGIQSDVEPDSLYSLLVGLKQFGTRNTGADTTSTTQGIGATRNWILDKFEQYSSRRENRLLTGFFQFDQNICGVGRHKNVVAILPGTDTSNKEILIIEGHFDSRREGVCDTACYAPGRYIGKDAIIRISDQNGKVLAELPKQVEEGINEILYEHGFGVEGIFLYSLIVDGELIDTKKMVFAY